MNWFKRKYRQIKRTIEFFPLIWTGADWDYRYAVDLFTYQLSRTADYLEKKNRHNAALSEAKRIRTTVDLLEKVYDEDYGMEYLEIIKEKYGNSKFRFVPTKETDENGSPYYDMVDTFEYNYTDSELLMIAEERHAELLISRAKQKRAHKIAWDLVEHNIQKWWD